MPSLLFYCRKSNTINTTMKTDLKAKVLKRMQDSSLKAFSCFDFVDLSSYKTISKCLERLEDTKAIKRIIDGIYCLNITDESLNLPILPSVDDVASCLARKHAWTIFPSENVALNLMGLSEQVPSSYNYISSGPYKTYSIYGMEVSFKKVMSREIANHSFKTQLLIQCIKALGKGNLTEKEIEILRSNMTHEEKNNAFYESVTLQSWIRDIIVRVCGA